MPRSAVLAAALTATLTVALTTALTLAPLAAAGPPVDADAADRPPAERVPVHLLDDTVELRRALENASAATGGGGALADAHARAAAVAPDVLPHLRTLGGPDGDLLAELWDRFDAEAAAGNRTNARSLARAAVNTLRDDLEPRVRAWDRVRTTITPGSASDAGDGTVRVPVLLLNPPRGGLGAFDVEVRAPPADLVPVAAEVAVGQGQARVAAANGSARLAAFDAQALAGLSSGAPAVTLGTVIYRAAGTPVDGPPGAASPGDGAVPLLVLLHDVVDPSGEPVPAVAPAGAIAPVAAVPGGLPPWTALVVVGGLGVVAAWAIRRRLKV